MINYLIEKGANLLYVSIKGTILDLFLLYFPLNSNDKEANDILKYIILRSVEINHQIIRYDDEYNKNKIINNNYNYYDNKNDKNEWKKEFISVVLSQAPLLSINKNRPFEKTYFIDHNANLQIF